MRRDRLDSLRTESPLCSVGADRHHRARRRREPEVVSNELTEQTGAWSWSGSTSGRWTRAIRGCWTCTPTTCSCTPRGRHRLRQGHGRVRGTAWVRPAMASHDVENLHILVAGDHVIVEGTERGMTRSGRTWPDGVVSTGRFCNVFEFDSLLIRRLHIYVDPSFTSSHQEQSPCSVSRAGPDDHLTTCARGRRHQVGLRRL